MKKITEKMLLDNFVDLTNGCAYMSVIAGQDIFWQYRAGRSCDGYNTAVDTRDKANEITLEYSRTGTIALGECADHPALAEIDKAQRLAWGDMVA